jgi:hypothetical protein
MAGDRLPANPQPAARVTAQLKHSSLNAANHGLKYPDMACEPIAPIPYLTIRMAVYGPKVRAEDQR